MGSNSEKQFLYHSLGFSDFFKPGHPPLYFCRPSRGNDWSTLSYYHMIRSFNLYSKFVGAIITVL